MNTPSESGLKGDVMLHWHVVQIESGKAVTAGDFIEKALEFELLVPLLRRRRHYRGRMVVDDVPRYGVYILARFDAEQDPWGHLMHSKARRCGIVKVLCNAEMRPSPVPDAAVEAIRLYRPAEEEQTLMPHVFQPGEPCRRTIAGIKLHAVFVAYVGNRQFVRTWIFGSEHVAEVGSGEIEPIDNSGETTLPTQR